MRVEETGFSKADHKQDKSKGGQDLKQISSRDNSLVKLAASLKNGKHRQLHRLFLLEGDRAVKELLSCPTRLVALFVDESLKERHLPIIAALGEDRTYLVDEKIIRHICDTKHPQGIAAMASIASWSLEELYQRPGVWLWLDRVSDPGNMGTIIRTSLALGGQGIIMSPETADPFSPKAVRSSMGAVLTVPVVGPVTINEMPDFKQHGIKLFGSAAESGTPYYQARFQGSFILVIGGEARGMEPDLIKYCDETLYIPMKAGVNSLNAAAACAIILGEALRQRSHEPLS